MSDFYRNHPEQNNPYRARNPQDSDDAWYPNAYADAPDGYEPDAYSRADGASSGGSDQPEEQSEQVGDPYFAWRRPDGNAHIGESFLTEQPAPFGAELQQGGVPLYDVPQAGDDFRIAGDDFRIAGDDAPTRIAAPVQMVKKRTTVVDAQNALFERRASGAPAMQTPQPPAAEDSPANQKTANEAPRRRRSRMDRHAEQTSAPVVHDFDPFGAGDSEASASAAEGMRAAVPGGRYTGARTAMPSPQGADAAPQPRAEGEPSAPAQPPRRPMPQAGNNTPHRPMPQAGNNTPRRPMPQVGSDMPRRPMPQAGSDMPRRPMPQAGNNMPRRPMPQAQGEDAALERSARPSEPSQRPQMNRPVRQPMQEAEGASAPRPAQQSAPARRPVQQQGAPQNRKSPSPEEAYARRQASVQGESPYAYRAQPGRPGAVHEEQRASVNRKPYEFENEEQEKPRRKGALLPVIIVLLVVGGLLAGLCLPNWKGMNNQLGSTVAPIQEKVVAAFTSVKNMILPEEEPIKSFTVSTSDTAAPATLRLTVQTAKSVKGIRVADDSGQTVYSSDFNDQKTLSGEVIENSNALIWTPSCVIKAAYIGGFTVYAQKSDGTESEGLRAENTVNIAQPKPVLPPLQAFTCDTEEAAVPATVGFTVVTSADVTAVRVVDQYNSPVVTMMFADGDSEKGRVEENGETRTWTLSALIESPITGSYAVQYQTASDSLNYTDGGYSVFVKLTAAPPKTQTDDQNAGVAPTQSAAAQAVATKAVATQTVAQTVAPTPAPTATPAPTDTPVPAMTQPAPENTSLPALAASTGATADPASDDIKLKPTIYVGGKAADSYTRANKISMLTPFTTYAGLNDYALWKQAGVLTFRSGPMRQNAAYGTVEVADKKLTEVWSQPVGSTKLSNDTLYGVNAPGQPVIVKWPAEVRQRMALLEDARGVTALKEVIVAGQDGKLYFFNLLDGTATREIYDLGAPSAGGLSVATNGTPILGVGQSHSKLATKTVKSGYHIINLLKNKEELLVSTDGKDKNSNYSGVLGAALFDSRTGTMIFGSQGGVLYTAELGRQTQAYDHLAGQVKLNDSVQAYKAMAKGQDKKQTNIDASIAMYNNYVYFGDQEGILQCVDVNTMTPVWAIRTDDNIDATPALDMESDESVALYTGNTILNLRKQGVCTLRRVNALTGNVDWSYEVPDVTFQSEYDVGAEASPVVGEKGIDDLVIFTVTNGANGAKTVALNKKTGALKWQADYAAETISSPVAVYNQNGDAWIIQALSDGSVNLLDGATGEVLDTLKLDTEIKASPAVYGNLLIIGTTGKANSAVYCIRID